MQEINKTTEQNEKKQSIMENRFNNLKEEILKRAKAADISNEIYPKLYYSNNACELLTVVKDNFNFCFMESIIDVSLIQEYEELFNGENIYTNEDVSDGYLLASGNAQVKAYNSSFIIAQDITQVEAWENATVMARGNAIIIAQDNTQVEAWENAAVMAQDNATVTAWGQSTVEARENATVRAQDNATAIAWDKAEVKSYNSSFIIAQDNTQVEAWDNVYVEARDKATVRAWDNAYIISYYMRPVALNDNSIYRVKETNTVYFASDTLKFEKVPTTLEAE